MAAIGYFIKDWNYQFLASFICLLLCALPSCFIIESPRFYAIKKDVSNVKISLQKLAKMNGVELNIEDIDLVDLEFSRQQNILQQLKDFIQYPVLIFETLIQMLTWFLVAMSYYGFNFGWESLVPSVYLGYLIAGFSEAVMCVLHAAFVHLTGRRRSMIVLLIGAIIIFLTSILDIEIGKNWTVESITSLVGLMCITSAFAGIYFYSSELAPTSHRGMVFAMSSGSAGIGSFLGPFVINNLYDITHKAVPLSILSFLALLCIAGMFYLVETGDKTIPAVPTDVKERRKFYKLRF